MATKTDTAVGGRSHAPSEVWEHVAAPALTAARHEPGTITGRRGLVEGLTRMAIVAVVSAVIAYMFVIVMRDYDAATYRGPTQGDGWQNRNHTGITPYGYPADNAGPPRGRQDCTYDGRRLDCGPRQDGGR